MHYRRQKQGPDARHGLRGPREPFSVLCLPPGLRELLGERGGQNSTRPWEGACGPRRGGAPFPPPKTARGPPYWTVAGSSDLSSFSRSSGFPGRASVSAGREADHMSQHLHASRPARAHPEHGPWTHLQRQPPRRGPQASSEMSVGNTRLSECVYR